VTENRHYDVVVLGGGINGVGIAADAAMRNLSVLLCEQNDLASGTSSASSKLIHGGLRYLETYQFKLVRESLKERETLLKLAPHLVHSAAFVVPFTPRHRPLWQLRMGLYAYDLLSMCSSFPRSRLCEFEDQHEFDVLKRSIRKGVIYHDAITEDSRLVIANAQRAAQAGCQIFTRHQCVLVERLSTHWRLTIENQIDHQSHTILCQVLVNATGPWINEVNKKLIQVPSRYHAQLVKGSHIVVPKLYAQNCAFVLQNRDGRIVFTIPYQKQFTLIGTTDTPFYGDDFSSIKIEPEEIEYLCQTVNEYFNHTLKPEKIIHSWSGVRALVASRSSSLHETSREYKLELIASQNEAPLLNIYGGKLTTYRSLAEKAIDLLKPFFPAMGKCVTKNSTLPGGDILEKNCLLFLETLMEQYEWLPALAALRYACNYGTLAHQLLRDSNKTEDLGQYFGHGLFEKEIRYLIENEWAMTLEDVLWRRTKLGLVLNEQEKLQLETWWQNS